ncbi:hypothetical protein GCM10010329_75670 [Streptomyces spiroverticillatus]|uniref:Uncharacterized protein n=1 Tax=Streptomyces finlayi TaxID=67296 RepID=A0A919CF58_9ACTN|nr:hypothetical protein GCM10010329_75670 [Streptomyces spiroverticillatus]GHD16622.1 hypothetical protein GCM10010334_77800 [Streptomyces finlayi]
MGHDWDAERWEGRAGKARSGSAHTIVRSTGLARSLIPVIRELFHTGRGYGDAPARERLPLGPGHPRTHSTRIS